MSELTVPQVDFSGLGQLPEIYKANQAAQLRQQTLASLGQGPVDAQSLKAAGLKLGDLGLVNLGVQLENTAYQHGRDATQDQRQAQRDKVGDQHWAASYELQKRSAQRADQGVPEKAADRAKAAAQFGLTPDMPEFKSFVLTGSLPETSNKPVPVETIGGTKFMVRQPNGGYTLVDPTALGQPQAQSTATQATAPPGAPAPSGAAPAPPAQPAIDADTVDPKTGRREGYLQSLDPQVRDYIKKVADYEIDPRTTSVKGGMREKLMSAVAKYDPTYNQNDFGARAKAIKDFSTGTQGNIVRSFDVAVDHLDTLQKAADAMKNGDVKALNAIRNAWREQTGSDLPTNFKSLVPLVSGEIAKAVIGSNNALSDREELRSNLQAAQSPEQIGGVISSYKALMGGQLKGLKKQYEESTGKKDFEHRIRDATRRELEGGRKSEPGVTSTGVKWSVE